MVGVVPHLRREIERDGQTRLPGLEQMMKPDVRLFGRSEPGILAHGPQPATVHRGMYATRVGKRARSAQIAVRLAAPIRRAVHRPPFAHRDGTSLCSNHVASSTSCLLPMMSGVRWCRVWGTISRIGAFPLVASPPACSATIASGAAS